MIKTFISVSLLLLLVLTCVSAEEEEAAPVRASVSGNYRIMASIYSQSGSGKIVLGATATDLGGIIRFEAEVVKVLYSSKPLSRDLLSGIPPIIFDAVLTGSSLYASSIHVSATLSKSETSSSFAIDVTGSLTATVEEESGSLNGTCEGILKITRPDGSTEVLPVTGTFNAWKMDRQPRESIEQES